MKYYFVRRFIKKDNQIIDAGIVDVPERDIKSTLARNPLWKIMQASLQDAPVVPQPVVTPIQGVLCPICSKEFKNQNGLRLHKRAHDK